MRRNLLCLLTCTLLLGNMPFTTNTDSVTAIEISTSESSDSEKPAFEFMPLNNSYSYDETDE